MELLQLISFPFFILLHTTVDASSILEAASAAGTFIGRFSTSYEGRQFVAFSGIPYARPPVGPLRFKDPEPLDKLTDTYEAVTEKDDCIQFDSSYNKYPDDPSKKRKIVGSEDCLYLNVYTPSVKPTNPLPVMVMIHGGANLKGSGSSELLGPEILMDRDVILVTLNYRLGLFGFLTLGNEKVAPGNFGLKDQSVALHWVKNNIEAFGGDTSRITLFGESAGGASTHLHMLSPRSKGTFVRAISQSGTADCVWAIKGPNQKLANAIAVSTLVKHLECPEEPKEALECLQQKPASDLLLAARRLSIYASEAIFNTVLENDHSNAFLTKEILESTSTIPWMAGVNSAEGLVVYGGLARNDPDLTELNRTYGLILPRMLRYNESPNKENITKRIKEHYLQDSDFSKEKLKSIIDLFSESMFIHGQVKSAKKHVGPLYQYFFSHQGQRIFNPSLKDEVALYGADHGDELLYLFHYKKATPKIEFNEEDKNVSNLLLDLWTSFAANGDPTEGKDTKWPESQKGKLTAEISSSGIQIKENILAPRVAFWDSIEHLKYPKDEL